MIAQTTIGHQDRHLPVILFFVLIVIIIVILLVLLLLPLSQQEERVSADNDDARRAYWTTQMEAAYAFMMVVRDCPVAECGEPLVPLKPASEEAGVAVAFSQSKVARDFDRLFFLRVGLIEAFLAAAREILERGWILKVEDGFRTREIQRLLALKPEVFDRILERTIGELGGRMPSPELVFRRVTVLVATMPKVGTHMSGSAIDVSVLDRASGAEIDRGGPYLEMSELTPMGAPFISETARRNRREITGLMARHGFVAYPYEFWHYSQGDAFAVQLGVIHPPARYGAVDADLATGRTTAIENPGEWLNSVDVIESEMNAALRRLRA